MIKAEITPSWYQKTKILEDGITQMVIPDKVYGSYDVKVSNIYFIEDKIEMLKQLREDLIQLCDEIDLAIGEEYRKQLVKEKKL